MRVKHLKDNENNAACGQYGHCSLTNITLDVTCEKCIQKQCSIEGHPGVIWHNVGGTEPYMSCKRCGLWLG